MPEQTSLFSDANYAAFLNGLKQRIRSAQVNAATAVNQELILLYWQIGRDILTRQETEWGGQGHPAAGERPQVGVPRYAGVLALKSPLYASFC
jgi:hypothetical protein